MIQFNLLPDVKLEYLRTQRKKRAIITLALLSSAALLTVFVLLLIFVRVKQPYDMRALDKDIKSASDTLKEKEDLDKVLTIQNQLNSLPALHEQKVYSSRLFDYLSQLTPAQATISDVTLDFGAGTLNIKGNANSLETVNKFVDTLKFTDYKLAGDEAKEGKAFKDVVLANFAVQDSRSVTDASKNITYELSLSYDASIFANVKGQLKEGEKPVTLVVPNTISTRSATEKPSSLFVPQPETNSGGSR
jgi:Tfp pilus assembly protein PilN